MRLVPVSLISTFTTDQRHWDLSDLLSWKPTGLLAGSRLVASYAAREADGNRTRALRADNAALLASRSHNPVNNDHEWSRPRDSNADSRRFELRASAVGLGRVGPPGEIRTHTFAGLNGATPARLVYRGIGAASASRTRTGLVLDLLSLPLEYRRDTGPPPGARTLTPPVKSRECCR